MAQPSVRADVHEALDIHGDLTPEVALDVMLRSNDVPQLGDFLVGEILRPGVWVDLSLSDNFIAYRAPDPVDIGERNLYTLIARDVDS